MLGFVDGFHDREAVLSFRREDAEEGESANDDAENHREEDGRVGGHTLFIGQVARSHQKRPRTAR